MEFFSKKTNIDFMGIKKITASLSIIMIILSLFFIFTKGLNLGLDFTGGYQVQVNYNSKQDINVVNKELIKNNFTKAEVTSFGSGNSLMIKLPVSASDGLMKKNNVSTNGDSAQEKLQQKIQSAVTGKVVELNYIGSEVGKELANNGILAILIALICVIGYIAFRFEMKFAISAGVALLHDPIIILGVFSAFNLEFNLTALAALLAVIGYSLNDTVVIYDRVRENFRKLRNKDVKEVINRSVNDTLSRTVITSGLMLLVVVVLFLFGGPSIHGFSLALILGVVVGTYSSIYVAGVLSVALGLKRESLLPAHKSNTTSH